MRSILAIVLFCFSIIGQADNLGLAHLLPGWEGHGLDSSEINHYANPLQTHFFFSLYDVELQKITRASALAWDYQATDSWLFGVKGYVSGQDPLRSLAEQQGYVNFPNPIDAIKGRIAYSFDQWLPYISGGIMTNQLGYNLKNTLPVSPWEKTWIAGAGIEYRANSRLALGLSYDYLSLNVPQQGMGPSGSALARMMPILDNFFASQSLMASIRIS